jgi:hypothetical protein
MLSWLLLHVIKAWQVVLQLLLVLLPQYMPLLVL